MPRAAHQVLAAARERPAVLARTPVTPGGRHRRMAAASAHHGLAPSAMKQRLVTSIESIE
ncbi:hypothetical protein [Streptomyces sp. NPDC002215]|uniref:hypothetical protein n=1 Tax=Streptomyces sp. NPDC002215 TaxID=3154412 RepID=UPI00332DB76D